MAAVLPVNYRLTKAYTIYKGPVPPRKHHLGTCRGQPFPVPRDYYHKYQQQQQQKKVCSLITGHPRRHDTSAAATPAAHTLGIFKDYIGDHHYHWNR